MIAFVEKRKYRRSPEGEARRIAALRTPEARARMSASKKGKTPQNHQQALEAAWAVTRAKGINSYIGFHMWVYRNWGQPDTCEFCGTSGLTGRRINWAHKWATKKLGGYTLNREDWLRLCKPCHFRYDRQQQGVNFFGGHHLPPIES